MSYDQRARSNPTAIRISVGIAGTIVCLVLGAGLGWVLGALRSGEAGPTPRAAPSQAFEDQEAFAGELALDVPDGAARVRVTLTRLQARTERQAFDAHALRRRFDLAPGEPFQCEVENRGPAGEAAPGIDLALLVVCDDQGVALAPLFASAAPGDPLRTLFTAPAESLVPGTGARFVLWGRAPRAGARAECGALSISLAATSVPRDPRGDALARVDRTEVREESR